MAKFDFPKFHGEDVKTLIHSCEQFFALDNTLEEYRVKIATMHLEGKMAQWYMDFLKNRLSFQEPRWVEFVNALVNIFDSLLFDDPAAILKSLKQVTLVEDYVDNFDFLTSRVEISGEYALSFFFEGLKDEIEIPV